MREGVMRPLRPGEATRRTPFEAAWKLGWLHATVVVFAVGLTLIAWYDARMNVQERIAHHFDRQADQTIELVIERMRKYEDALWSAAAFIEAHRGTIDHSAWEKYTESIQVERKYPGINGIGTIEWLLRDELPTFLRRQRQRYPRFEIHPRRESDEFWPITSILPLEGNEQALGLDMAHERNRITAARKAKTTGTAQVTGPIVLVQDSKKTPGFLFYAPFYRSSDSPGDDDRQVGGLVYAPFVVRKLMKGVLEKQKRQVGVRITDENNVLFDEHIASDHDFDPNPWMTKSVPISLYGRTWNFDLRTTKSFRENIATSQPTVILLAGLIINALLIGLLRMASQASRRALGCADVLTADLEKLELAQAAILECAGVAIIATDPDGVIVTFNQAAQRMLGYREDEVLQCQTPGIFHDAEEVKRRAEELSEELGREIQPGFDVFVQHAIEGRAEQREWTYIRKDKTTFPALLTVTALRDRNDAITGYLGVASDISELRRIQAAMESANATLERSNKELEQFAYVASHDLQEPLRKVTSFCELLQEDLSGKISSEADLYVEYIMDGATRMRALIKDLLSYSRIDSAGFRWKDFQAVDAVQAALDNLSEAISESHADISCGTLPEVTADPIQFTQLFQNLIGNAIKYRGNRTPEIRVTGEVTDNGWAFAVEDNGIGIEPRFREQIFGIFKRLHNRTEYEGTGIGLAVCARIIDRLGGRIWVDESDTGGSVFHFEIPDPSSTQIDANTSDNQLQLI